MGKRQELELEAIRLYADGLEIPEISKRSREEDWYVSENTLRKWKDRAGNEWQDARKAARQSQLVSMEDVGSRLRRSREIASQLMGSAKHQSDMGMALNQALQTGIYDLIGQIQTIDVEDEAAIDAAIERVNMLTLSLSRLETSAFRNNKTVVEIRKQALGDAAQAVGEEARAQGMDDEQAEFWMKKILGVV